MEELSARGGALVGWVNATWPLARLVASATCLRLSIVIDTYDFLPSEVVSLERYAPIPFFASGVRIVHARQDYPRRIIFWSLDNPERLIEQIRDTGFSPTASSISETERRGFPVRWTAILLFLLIWNGLMLLAGSVPSGHLKEHGLFALLALLMAFLVCWGTKTSPILQKMILSDGHSVTEIKAYLSLVQIVTGFLVVIFSVLVLTHTFG